LEIDSTETSPAQKLDLSHYEVVPALAHLPFDAYRTERMRMHVPHAERAFAEMVRVIRRRGRLSVFDFDWETQMVDSHGPCSQQWRYRQRLFRVPRHLRKLSKALNRRHDPSKERLIVW
jgi:ubiquinone/menaquinone biosynthesis C-methylase UbiE